MLPGSEVSRAPLCNLEQCGAFLPTYAQVIQAAHTVKTMLKNVTRSKVLQIWFTAVMLIAVAGTALGVSVTMGTGALLLGACLVPPGIALMLWPGAQSPTVGDVLRGSDRR